MLDSNDLKLIEGIMTRSLAPIKSDIAELKTDVAQLKTEMAEVKADIIRLETGQRDTNFYIENVLDKKISIIAEGHLDLARKLDDALKINNEKEMLQLRVTSLEYDVKQIKKAMAIG